MNIYKFMMKRQTTTYEIVKRAKCAYLLHPYSFTMSKIRAPVHDEAIHQIEDLLLLTPRSRFRNAYKKLDYWWKRIVQSIKNA